MYLLSYIFLERRSPSLLPLEPKPQSAKNTFSSSGLFDNEEEDEGEGEGEGLFSQSARVDKPKVCVWFRIFNHGVLNPISTALAIPFP